MKILVALDDSKHSGLALEFVSRMRWPAGSRMLVVSVVPPMTAALAAAYGAGANPPGLAQERQDRVEEVISNAEDRLREAGFPTEGRVLEGDPGEELVRASREERADLLVVGSHGRTGLARMLLGSVSSRVVMDAPCSVLVVKGPAWLKKIRPMSDEAGAAHETGGAHPATEGGLS